MGCVSECEYADIFSSVRGKSCSDTPCGRLFFFSFTSTLKVAVTEWACRLCCLSGRVCLLLILSSLVRRFFFALCQLKRVINTH